MELTQSRMRFLLLGALIALAFIFLSSSNSVRSHPMFANKPPGGPGREHPDHHHDHPGPGPESKPEVAKPDIKADAPPKPPGGTKGDGPKENKVPAAGGAPKVDLKDETKYLSVDAAKEFCEFKRFEPWTKRDKHRKIYDLILVNRELEWLDIRLGQMYSHVDYFVIVEADVSFTDQPKTLYLKENWERYAKYHDKMIRHTLSTEGKTFENTWARETFSRNAMVTQVLPFLKDEQKIEIDDVIIIADVDEIPRPDTLTAMRNCVVPDAFTLRSRMYYYSFQWLQREDWAHPQAMLWKGLEDTMPADVLRMGAASQPHMYNAAWHCSYCLKSLADMVNKVTSFSHTEFNKPEFRDPQKILNRVRKGLDFFDRPDSFFDRVENNEDVPEFLKKNKEKYAFAVDRDPPNGNFQDDGPVEAPKN